MKSFLMQKNFIGDSFFYRRVAQVALPIIIQNTLTNFVQLLDGIMVGRLGTDPMNGVSIVGQLVFVLCLCMWGAGCGAGIFTAQYFGKEDHKGVADTFRIKAYLITAITVTGSVLLSFYGDFFIKLFIHDSNGAGDPAATLKYGHDYLNIMIIGFIPMAIGMIYSNTLRDIGETSVPMKAGVAAIFVNLFLNWVLIFGNLGAPKLGVIGAGIATVIARFVEVTIVLVWTHTHKNNCKFIQYAYKTFKVPVHLTNQIILKGFPLAVNETLWSLGQTMMNQSYSVLGLGVVAAMNITSTIGNFFNVFFFAIGESIAIIVGQLLGADKTQEAKATAKKMTFLSVAVCIVIGMIMVFCKDVFPSFYNTENSVKELAAAFILINAMLFPAQACLHCCYFTIRSGGKTLITLLFDSVFVMATQVSTAFILTRFTSLSIIWIYFIVRSWEILKALIGIILVKKGIWVKNVTV